MFVGAKEGSHQMRHCWIWLVIIGVFILAFPAGVSAQTPDGDLRFTRLNLADGLSHQNVSAILQDRNGVMWLGSDDGLNKYDGYHFTVYYPDFENANSLSAGTIQALYQDAEGILWIGTWGGGVTRFDPATEQFTRYQYAEENPHSLSNDMVYAITEDRAGGLWIGTEDGLNRFDRASGQFSRFYHAEDDPASLSDSFCSRAISLGSCSEGYSRKSSPR